MVVNDDQIQNLICRKVFSMNLNEVEVIDFIDPTEALSVIKDRKANPKFILLDVNMPGMNGWEFIDQIEKEGFNYPVVMFTASVDEEDRDRANKSELVKMFLDKPMTKDKLPLLEPLLNGEHS